MKPWVARLRDPAIILPYDGFGTPQALSLCGRVLEDEGFAPPRDKDRAWRNLVAMLKRFESDEIPGARVLACYRDLRSEAVADSEGYFTVELRPRAPALPGLWHKVGLRLIEPRGRASATGSVLVPSSTARFGVISDLDDTVIRSNVTNKARMLITLALSNARTRKPFQGVAAFYRALHAGASGSEGNPIFYVSKSPWNLYVPLVEFLANQNIPRGPLLLRDYGRHLLRPHGDHKKNSISRILSTYPGLKFVLIGDSGEQDPEIYSEVVRRWPERVRVIYIRSVSRDPSRLAAIDRLAEEVRPTGCQLVLAPDSEFAAAHAAGEGLIAPAALARIRREKAADEGLRPARTQ